MNSDKWLLIAGLVTLLVMVLWVFGMDNACPAELIINDQKLADAIYRAEGGAKTKFPYGIKSINTHGDKEYARKICLNSIRNAKKRWASAGNPEDFITFMSRRYCPPSAHKLNRTWGHNVKYWYAKLK